MSNLTEEQQKIREYGLMWNKSQMNKKSIENGLEQEYEPFAENLVEELNKEHKRNMKVSVK